jgi:sugar/nucleoside kinase (ribokinase family)
MTRTPQVTCIGLANVDVIANVGQEFLAGNGIIPGASTVLDPCQTGNLLSRLTLPEFCPGGASANTACGLALFGIETRFIGKTGDDVYADIFRRGFRDVNVAFDTPPHSQRMTSTCLTLVTPDKNRSFAICPETAGWFLGEADLPEIAGGQNHSVYLEANAASMPHRSGQAARASLLESAIGKYREAGVDLFLNLNDSEIINQAYDVMRAALDARLRFYIGNINEVMALFRCADAQEALAAAAASGRNFAVTAGADGAYVIENGIVRHQETTPLPPGRMVNTIGAGDQFAAGFVAGFVSGLDVMECVRTGIRAATEILLKKDARPDPAKFSLKLAAAG